MSAELLPCPFCGHSPDSSPMLGVWCSNDDCPVVGNVFSGGASHWNRRPPASSERVALSEEDVMALARTASSLNHYAAGRCVRMEFTPANILSFVKALNTAPRPDAPTSQIENPAPGIPACPDGEVKNG
jgi:hypothetical protein